MLVLGEIGSLTRSVLQDYHLKGTLGLDDPRNPTTNKSPKSSFWMDTWLQTANVATQALTQVTTASTVLETGKHKGLLSIQ
jgi:hypothetical protein